jgi:hypothetical protein
VFEEFAMKTRLIACLTSLGLLAFAGLVATAADGRPIGATTSENSSAVEVSKPAYISTITAEVVKLADSGANTTVLESYVNNSQSAYQLSADEIIYLHQHGVSDSVVTAMIERGARLTTQAVAHQTAAASTTQQPTTQTTYSAAPTTTTYTPSRSVSTVTYIGGGYPYYYSYSYPWYSSYYGYPGYWYGYPRSYYYSSPYYYGWPALGFSFSFGGHSRYHGGGFHGGYHGGFRGGARGHR